MDKRRTNPSFLSNDEAARDTKRTIDFVRSIAVDNPVTENVYKKKHVTKQQKTTSLSEKRFIRGGKTEDFIVDFERQNKLISIYGKEIPYDCAFKLKVRISETKTLIYLLEKAITVLGSNADIKVGERKNFSVDCDNSQRKVIVYRKETEFQFKLALNQNDVTSIIELLKKARTLL